MPYDPPYRLTSRILEQVEEIGEHLGRIGTPDALPPRLRRENRIKTIQASLAIEQNTLSLEQVTAIFDGKRVLGSAREVQEVRNAIVAYDRIGTWDPCSEDDLLAAHGVLMMGLVDQPGRYRHGAVGVFKGDKVQHVAPPAKRVPTLVAELLGWLRRADVHPLVASSVFHYEFEFIHPFTDGNGRMGRLWQSLILRAWRPILASVPIESIVHDRQGEYYRALAEADRASDSTGFVEFMLTAIQDALRPFRGAVASDQVSDQVSDQDRLGSLLKLLVGQERSSGELMQLLGLAHRPSFRLRWLQPAIAAGLVEMTMPDNPSSRLQRYRLTTKGKRRAGRPEGR